MNNNHRIHWLFVTVLLVGLVAHAGLQPIKANAAKTAKAADDWTLVWYDNFDGPDGAAPDETNWGYELGGGGWGNAELEVYTRSTRNAYITSDTNAEDGKSLVIKANKDKEGKYTSARLLTKDTYTFQYGKVEIRAKLPEGKGLWPAFWMLGSNIGAASWPRCGEIDIMETVGTDISTNHGTIHGPGYSGGSGLTGLYKLPDGEKLSDDYHTYAVEWEENSIKWYVDGNLYETRTPDDLDGKDWVYNHPFFMILNVAIGGDWPGNPDSTTVFPQLLSVDYVRVYQQNITETPTPRPTRTPGAANAQSTSDVSTPYNDKAVELPGQVEAEDFDKGGEDIAFHETTPDNKGRQKYRTDGASYEVDILKTKDGIVLSHTAGGEWVNYSVNVAKAGTYKLTVRMAGHGGGVFHIEAGDGKTFKDVTGALTQPDTGGVGNYETVEYKITLDAGPQILRLVFDQSDVWGVLNNINWFAVSAS